MFQTNARSFSCVSPGSDGFLLSRSLLQKAPTSSAIRQQNISRAVQILETHSCGLTSLAPCWGQKREANTMGRNYLRGKTLRDLSSSLGSDYGI